MSFRWPVAALFAVPSVFGIVVFVATMAATRSFFNVGTEVDTLVTYIPEARLLAKFAPLEVAYHLPGYPFLLVLSFALLKDWLTAGLVVSAGAAAFVLAGSFVLFNRLWGGAAGLGALVGLATSAEFLSFGAQATSDVPFLAFYVGSLMFAVRALQTARSLDWVATGAFVCATIMMRTSGIALLLLFPLAFLMPQLRHQRRSAVTGILSGFAVVAVVWVLYCLATGSPFLPQKNHVNLALTYYSSGSRNSADDMSAVAGMFSSSAEVFLKDPARIATMYWQDLAGLPGAIARQLVWPPVLVLGLCGFWYWWSDRSNPAVFMLAAVTLASVFLLNLHSFDARFHLYLLPIFGASAGMFFARLLATTNSRVVLTYLIAGAGVLIALFGAGAAAVNAQAQVSDLENHLEFDSSIASVRRMTEADARIMTRKHSVPRYSDRQRFNLPNVESLAELCKAVHEFPDGGPVYLYMGREERRAREALAREIATTTPPAWLTLVDSAQTPAAWQLFRVSRPPNCS